MQYQQYLSMVMDKFSNVKPTSIDKCGTYVTNEKIVYWGDSMGRYFRVKLNIFSFIAYAEKVSEDSVKSFSKNCLKYACKNKKGLSRFFGNGVVSYSVLASENIDFDAKEYVSEVYNNHWGAFEVPIIFDLSMQKLYCYRHTRIWGSGVDPFIDEYLFKHFKLS